MPFHIWAKTSYIYPPKGLVSDKVVMTLMEPFMRKGRKVTTDNFFMLFLLAKELKKKKANLVGTMNKVRLELPASAKCLHSGFGSWFPLVAHCCFLQHSGFGRHQCICAL